MEHPIDVDGDMRDHHLMEATFPSRGLTLVAAALGAAAVLATAVVFVMEFRDNPSAFIWLAPFVGAYAAGVVAFRLKPGHLAARRLLVFGTLATIWIGSTVAVVVAFESQGQRWWLGPANVGVQLAGLAMEAAMIAMLAVYPDGSYHRTYERRTVKIVAIVALTVPLVLLVSRSSIQPSWGFAWGAEPDSPTAFPVIASPLHVAALDFVGLPTRALLDGGLLLGPVVASILVILRYRRLTQQQELQVRWPMYGVLVLLLMPLAALLHEFGGLPLVVFDAVVILALLTLPASVVIGLVKPDLFDVDHAMRRSFVYAPLWLAIAAMYVGVAAALGTAASPLGLQVTVAVTIVATLLVEPARRRLAQRATRWARGTSLNGEEMVRWLGETLEHPLDQHELAAALAKAAREGLGVRWTTIAIVGLQPVTHGERRGEEPSVSAELVHAGEHLGEIHCGPRTRGRMQSSDIDGLDTLARQAALTIHNARLAADLRLSLHEIQTQATELAASRSRIVAAEASARRQIERDIHDGAQQDLVAMIARIGLARNELADDDGVEAMLDELQGEVRTTLAGLRQLASGIHPTELSDHGLVEAIEGRSARLPLPVTIDCVPELRSERFDEQVEGAAYFFVSEGLANALKHARAERARVRITRTADHLEIEVSDDGVGFESNGVSTTGLRGLTDRMESLGGSVSLDSAPGRGTRLGARLPIRGPRAD
ncbi:MAG: histidine kinase [Aeromicrobium sp.]